jgi:hypothetical protein
MTPDMFVEDWVSLISHPYTVNDKQGFVLKNGMRILFENPTLSHESKRALSKHYTKENV